MNRRQAITALTTTGITGATLLALAEPAAADRPNLPRGADLVIVWDTTLNRQGAIQYRAGLRVTSLGQRDPIFNRMMYDVRWGVDMFNYNKDPRTAFYHGTRIIWDRKGGTRRVIPEPERHWTLEGHLPLTKWFGGRWRLQEETNYTASGSLRYGALGDGPTTIAQWSIS